GHYGRTGGIILATGDVTDIEALVHADPFITTGAATAQFTEFEPIRISPRLACLTV
ncbi:MAG: hypothetical protein JO285_00320, partial [Kutzneria sp.]|nr:hypothetical protein [Kutzneria sp.]